MDTDSRSAGVGVAIEQQRSNANYKYNKIWLSLSSSQLSSAVVITHNKGPLEIPLIQMGHRKANAAILF
jgi:hypothetical protein